MKFVSCVVAAVFAAGLVATPAAAGQPAAQAPKEQKEQQPPAPKPDPKPTDPKTEEQQKYEETVVVSASKTEQKLVNAPATMSVLGGRAIQNATTQNFADLLRSVPGVNVTQISGRDINITSRGATGTLSTGQLALLDGRSMY